MDIAPNSNKNGKRVCFSPMDNLSPSNPISTTAIDVAKTSITIALRLLPPAISSLAELYSHSQNKECITKDLDHIPCSACFKFKLRTSVRVLEHYGDQFKTLVEQTEQHITVLQLQLHDTIVSLTNWKLLLQELPLPHFIVEQ